MQHEARKQPHERRLLELADQDPAGKRESLLQDLNSIRQDRTNMLKVAERWQGLGANEVLRLLLLIFYQMTRVKMTTPGISPGQPVKIPCLQALANELDLMQIVSCYDETLKHYQALTGPFNLNVQGILEDLIIFWQSLGRQIEEERR